MPEKTTSARGSQHSGPKAERISNSFLARSKRGLYNGGSLPLGYRIDSSKPGHLFIDPEEAEVVLFTFQSFLKMETLAATAKFLTANKIQLPRKVHGSGAIRESQFTVDSLYRLLRNKAYIGIRVYQTKSGREEVPAAKLEPLVWQEVKQFVLSDVFANDLLEKAKYMQEVQNQTDELAKVKQRITLTEKQIEVLAERIGALPMEIDPKPLVDQLGKLQKTKNDLEEIFKSQEMKKPQLDEPINYEDLKSFRKGLKSLVEKAEANKTLQTSIIRKVVHQIIIKPDGFEIHFHIGKTHYSRSLGIQQQTSLAAEKNETNPPKPARASQSFHFFKSQGSSLLTIGDFTRN